MMKSKTRVLVLLILSTITTGLFYFMTFKFNVKFNSLRNILYVKDYIAAGGLVLIIIILSLLVVFTFLFIYHSVKDSKSIEIFDQSGMPEYYKKDNHFSFFRIYQYYAIISAFLVILRDGYRVYSYDTSTMSLYIFKTDILFLMWDTVLWLFVGLTITLVIEYLNQLKAIEV